MKKRVSGRGEEQVYNAKKGGRSHCSDVHSKQSGEAQGHL